MSISLVQFLNVVAYTLLGHAIMRLPARFNTVRLSLFAGLNLYAGYLLATQNSAVTLWNFVTYLVILFVHWLVIALYERATQPGSKTFLRRLALYSPLVLLVVIKVNSIVLFIGISYMAFRMSYLAFELDAERVRQVDIVSYLAFMIFPPTMLIGPISPFGYFRHSLEQPLHSFESLKNSLLRILIGAAKFMFLAHIFQKLSFSVLWADYYRHGIFDFIVSGIAFYLYIFLNFSGFCDVVIGISGLIGIKVKENFNNPFGARNLRELWNRWHISLSEYMRDVFFTPLSHVLAKKLSLKATPHVIAASLFLTFVLIGLWHGVGYGYLLFGVAHGGAMVILHYYTLLLKRLLKRNYRTYIDNIPIRCAATVLTFLFMSTTMFFFENDAESMKRIAEEVLVWKF